MTEDTFTNGERQLLAIAAAREFYRMRSAADPFMEEVVDEMESAVRKLSGEGVRLVARRA